jgi:hypothetical protein
MMKLLMNAAILTAVTALLSLPLLADAAPDAPAPATSVSSDGVYAFTPNPAGGSVTVMDVLNGKLAATAKVCDQPQAGALTPDGVSYIVVCNGGTHVNFVNTASFKVTAETSAKIAPRTAPNTAPATITLSKDGRFGLITHPAAGSVSLLDVALRQIADTVNTGGQPVTVRFDASGNRAVVLNADGATLNTIDLPFVPPVATSGKPNEVVVMGMIHGEHRTSRRYSLKIVENMVRRIHPDVVLTEMPPNRFDEAARQFKETGHITESRISVFPEYVDVLFPLQKELGFQIVPTAGWNNAMNSYRNAAVERISHDPARAKEWDTYKTAQRRSDLAIAQGGDADDDPTWIHTDAYDAASDIESFAYNHFNAELGPGGWDNINQAHYGNIARWLDQHPFEGKRVLITYGSAHKGWILRHLRQRQDVKVLAMQPFLAGK